MASNLLQRVSRVLPTAATVTLPTLSRHAVTTSYPLPLIPLRLLQQHQPPLRRFAKRSDASRKEADRLLGFSTEEADAEAAEQDEVAGEEDGAEGEDGEQGEKKRKGKKHIQGVTQTKWTDRPPYEPSAAEILVRQPRRPYQHMLPVPIDERTMKPTLNDSAVERQINERWYGRYRVPTETKYTVERRIYEDKMAHYRARYWQEIQQARQRRQRHLYAEYDKLRDFRRQRGAEREQERVARAEKHKLHMEQIAAKMKVKAQSAQQRQQEKMQRLSQRREVEMDYVLRELKNTWVKNADTDINEQLFETEVVVTGWLPQLQQSAEEVPQYVGRRR